jgi:circadian clock protein KaiB
MKITEALEENFRNRKDKPYVLKLFVAGISPKSLKAIENIKKLFAEYEKEYKLEIIDIYQNPIIAKDGQIVAAPTLIKELPAPVKKFIGDMSDKNKLIVGLDLTSETDENLDKQ